MVPALASTIDADPRGLGRVENRLAPPQTRA